jgi:precorrin-6Y C5,15-methyltransferase (decarboxylating)
MADDPWLTIVGLGEDGPDGLPPASRRAIEDAEIVVGPPRHLGLLPDCGKERIEWPIPFADGLPRLKALTGRRVVVLASGDPFWFGSGSVIARELPACEWRALPGPSTFSLAAARLGWQLERTLCLGLHAAPLSRLRPHLSCGSRVLVLLRDGAAVADLAALLVRAGFGAARIVVLECLGGPAERVREMTARGPAPEDIRHPVCAAVAVAVSDGPAVPCASGRPDALFLNDGQLTKRPIRALTLSALAPRAGQRLWDIGAGSGSVAIEWLLSHPETSATAVEVREDRVARIRRNADELGVDRLEIVTGEAPAALEALSTPDAVFVGGGLSQALLEDVWQRVPAGTRLVANAVTLESEALLAEWQVREGGELLRIELAAAGSLGSKRGWQSAYPVVQWSVER